MHLANRIWCHRNVQYVWDPNAVNTLVERDRDADGSAADGLEERLYAQQDANGNVTAMPTRTASS